MRIRKFSNLVFLWLHRAFNADIRKNVEERNKRFLEEALELVQSCGMNVYEARAILSYVYDSKSVGKPYQEIGGVMITLSALCHAMGLDLEDAAKCELLRVGFCTREIQEKQETKAAAGVGMSLYDKNPSPASL